MLVLLISNDFTFKKSFKNSKPYEETFLEFKYFVLHVNCQHFTRQNDKTSKYKISMIMINDKKTLFNEKIMLITEQTKDQITLAILICSIV